MDLLIYGFPIFAGIIGSRYLSRLANFCLMIVVFQLDLAILFGQLTAAVFTPYTVLCIIPALAGIVGDRYFSKLQYDLQIGSRYFLIGKLANALLIIGGYDAGLSWVIRHTIPALDSSARRTLASRMNTPLMMSLWC